MTRTGHNRWLGLVIIDGSDRSWDVWQSTELSHSSVASRAWPWLSGMPIESVSKILVLIRKICFEITHLLNMSHKLGHLSRIFAAEIKNNCIMTLKELLDSLSFDEIAPFLIRHYHTIMRQEIWLLKSQLAACGIHHFGATYPTSVKNLSEKSPQIIWS